MSSKLRLAIFTETFLPKVDGIVTVTCILLDHLRSVGVEAIVFAPGPHPEEYAGHRVISVPGVPLPIYPEVTMALPGQRSREILEDFDPTLVHVMNPVLTGLKGMRFARSLRKPLVASFQAHLMEMVRFYGLGALQEPLWYLHRYVYRKADYCLAPSRRIVSELESKGFGQVGLWRRGVDVRRFSPDYADPAMREELSGGNPDKVLLLSVGRLAPEKQVEQILPVLDAVPNTHLAIVGDGPHRPKLEEVFAGRSVTFTGYKSGVELSRAFASADMFLFPSSPIETFGLVAAEALASGIPVVSSNVGGVPEIIEPGVNGYMFEPNDTAAMVAQVRELAENPERRRAMGHAAREAMCARSWAEVMNELLYTYERVIEAHHRRQAMLN
ncbi:MAG: glycosyltransferase family 1 protein [Anaerolineae bacterium]|nr:glycosyltransferase family 1 protein [Anaerolineae bacterium]